MKPSSLILLSGGLDSITTLIWAKENTEIKLALTFDYGQRAFEAEKRTAQALCKKNKIPHEILTLSWMKNFENALTDSSLTLPSPALHTLDDLEQGNQTAKAVWVPNRNGVFINIAASLAEARGIQQILLGFNHEEAQTFPDNSIPFIESINHSLTFSTLSHVKVIAPASTWNKKEIVDYLLSKKFDFENIWSCYENREKMCGCCESCQRLRRALLENHRIDLEEKFFKI